MRAFHITAVALPLLLGAGAAMAQQATGTVEKVDVDNKMVTVNGQPYQIEGQASGVKLTELKVGDKVTLMFDVNTNVVYQIDHAK